MTSTVKLESIKYEDCTHNSTCTCHFKNKKEPLVGDLCVNEASNGAEIKQEENVDHIKEEQEIVYISIDSDSLPSDSPPSDSPSSDTQVKNQNPLVRFPIISEHSHHSVDVQMEVEVSTSKQITNIVDHDDDLLLLILTPEQIHAPLISPFIENSNGSNHLRSPQPLQKHDVVCSNASNILDGKNRKIRRPNRRGPCPKILPSPLYDTDRENCPPFDDPSVFKHHNQNQVVCTGAQDENPTSSSNNTSSDVTDGLALNNRTYSYLPISKETMDLYRESIGRSRSESGEQFCSNDSQTVDEGCSVKDNDDEICKKVAIILQKKRKIAPNLNSKEVRDETSSLTTAPKLKIVLNLNSKEGNDETSSPTIIAPKPFPCSKCSRRCVSQKELDQHTVLHQISNVRKTLPPSKKKTSNLTTAPERKIEPELNSEDERDETSSPTTALKLNYEKEYCDKKPLGLKWENLTCTICSRNFTNLGLRTHYKFEHGVQFPFPCSKCSLRCVSQKELDQHTALRHTSNARKTLPSSKTKVQSASKNKVQSSSKSKVQLMSKQVKARGAVRNVKTPAVKCIECGARHTSIVDLDKHMEDQHPLIP